MIIMVFCHNHHQQRQYCIACVFQREREMKNPNSSKKLITQQITSTTTTKTYSQQSNVVVVVVVVVLLDIENPEEKKIIGSF